MTSAHSACSALSASSLRHTANPAAAAMFGYPEDVLRTMTLDALQVDDQVAHADAGDEAAL